MKLTPQDQEQFFKNLSHKYRAILLYGQDDATINEYKTKLSNYFVADKDPFRLMNYHEDKLITEPNLLFDEVCAMSFSSGDRLIIIENATDAIAKIVKDFLNEPIGEGFILMIGGNLMPNKSHLVQAMEKSPHSLSCRFFQDNERDVMKIIDDAMAQHQIKIESAARFFLAQELGNNRAITRMEVEKCCLFAFESKRLSYDDVVKLVGSGEATIDSLIEALYMGNFAQTESALFYLAQSKVEPIVIIRSVLSNLNKLEKLAVLCDNGEDFKDACKKLAIFWKSEAMMKKALNRFNLHQIRQFRLYFVHCEKLTKESNYPSQLLVERECLRIARV